MKRSRIDIRRLPALFLLLTGVAACTEWEDMQVEDEGSVCIEQEGEDVVVWVNPVRCLGGSDCFRDPMASCEAMLADQEIVVTSEATWSELTRGGECITVCSPLRASCVLPSVEPGSYTLRHGEHSEVVDIPTDTTCDPI
jgi:hypothetical protein